MNEYKLEEYIKFFKEKDNVFVCFKTEINKDNEVVDDRFFVYAYGGLLCKLPKDNNKQSTLLIFDKQYIEYLDKKNDKEEFEIEYQKAVREGTDTRFTFLKNNWSIIMKMMENRAEGKKYNGEHTHTHKERQRETVIAKINCDANISDFVICDMEFCVSFGDKKAKPDLVAVNINSCNEKDEVTIGYIEYKCTKSGVQGEKNSLKKHYEDMKNFSNSGSDLGRLTQKSIIERYNKMVEYELISSKDAKPISLGLCEIKSKIIFLITHKDEVGHVLENQCKKLLENSREEFKKGNIVFLQSKDENEAYLLKENFESEINSR